jgi:general secretion pathway protein G
MCFKTKVAQWPSGRVAESMKGSETPAPRPEIRTPEPQSLDPRPQTLQLGFSFIEIMVVIVIIGLLTGAVAIKVSDYVDKAKANRAKADVATIIQAVESFYLDNDRYPTNQEGLAALPLNNKNDPWNRVYGYNQPGRDGRPFEVFTYGRDGREGGSGPDTDITSLTLEQS